MANLSDARCTCPAYWQGREPRPKCIVHETPRPTPRVMAKRKRPNGWNAYNKKREGAYEQAS